MICTYLCSNLPHRATPLRATPTILSYDGEISSRLPWNASQAELQSALSSMSTLTTKSDYGNITYSVNTSRPQFCHSTLDSNTTFTFRSPYGNLYVVH